MSNTRQIVRYSLVGGAIFALVGCTFRPNLVGANIKNGGDEMKIVQVILSADDAKTIKAREIYFSIVIFDCNNYKRNFPVKPYIDGKPASEFNYSIPGRFTTVRGTIPAKYLVDFPNPCVALQGGSYIRGKLDATPVRLVWLAQQGRH
jgi:hypothetical protein